MITSLVSLTSIRPIKDTGSSNVYAAEYKETKNGTLPFVKKKVLVLGDLDEKGRATFAHIQLKNSDEPTKKRKSRLKTNPVGWHNFKFYFGDGRKKAWLMNRGHLIGYQFSGLNDNKKNLIPITNWLNTGHYRSMNSSNQDSMLYYEKRLDSWLATHKHYYLDYKVTPIYQGDELIPRQVALQYVGIDEKGNLLAINIGGKATQDANGISKVVLDNISPNAKIDYLTGKAQNIVASAKEQKATALKRAKEKRRAEKAKRAKEKRQAEKAKRAKEKRQAEEAKRIEAERQAAERAEQERQAAEAAQVAEQQRQAELAQVQAQSGYTRDARGRWHRPNGQYASKAEIAAAGLPW
nr:DNA/RNA non-specific endonuclease [Streptococcus castoreus]